MAVVAMEPRLYLADRDNQAADELSELVSSGEVRYNADNPGAKLTAQLQLRELPSYVQPLRTVVAPWLRLTYDSGEVVDAQCGLYVVVPARKQHRPAATSGGLELRDFTWLLAADKAGDWVTAAAGTRCDLGAAAELAAAGFTRVRLPATTKTLSRAWSWPPTTSRLARVNDLLAMYGCYGLYQDTEGWLTSRKARDLERAPVAMKYSSAAGSRVVPPIEDEPDITRLCNRVTVSSGDPAKAEYTYTADNQHPNSPSSQLNIGPPGSFTVIAREVQDSRIESLAEAQELAEQYLSEGASFYRSLRLQTLPDPRRQPHEIYELDIHNKGGEVATGRWWCRGWTLSLDRKRPTMLHQLHRVEAWRA